MPGNSHQNSKNMSFPTLIAIWVRKWAGTSLHASDAAITLLSLVEFITWLRETLPLSPNKLRC